MSASISNPRTRRVRATFARLVASVLVAVLVAGCTSEPEPDSKAGATSAGSDQVTIDVEPDKPILATLAGVVTIAGSAGSVDSPGQLKLTVVLATQADPPGLGAAEVGAGVEVELTGTSLVKDLNLTFTSRPATASSEESVPVLLHLSDDGAWDLDAASHDGQGQLTATTRDFSIRWPAWIDPVKFIRERIDSATDALVGRTDPDPCKDDAPKWASMDKQTTLVHACAVSNPDTEGKVRAEAQLKSNRRFFTLATVPPGSHYVWNEETTWLAKNVDKWLPSASGGNTVLLYPQSRMTAGYSQPTTATDGRFTITLDHYTAALSLAVPLVGGIVDEGLAPSRAGWAAVLASIHRWAGW